LHAKAIILTDRFRHDRADDVRAELDVPIYALTREERTRRRMALCRDVYPVAFIPTRWTA